MSKKAKFLTVQQKDYLIAEMQDSNDLRMEIIVLLLWGCVRPGDILNMRIQDLYKPAGELREQWELIEGKRQKTRLIPLRRNKLEPLLTKYYQRINHISHDKPLFYTLKTGRQLDSSALKKILKKFVGRRKIEQCSPYSLRKGGARFLYTEKKVTLDNVRAMMGHSSNTVTLRYICINSADVQKTQQILFE